MKYAHAFQTPIDDQRPSDVFRIINQTPATESVFSEDDCKKLDQEVRQSASRLSPAQLNDLRVALDEIAYRFKRAEGWSKNLTPIQQQKRAEKISSASRELLGLLLTDGATDPDLYDLNLVERHGIFESSAVHIGKLIAAIQIIDQHANSTFEGIESRMRSDNPYSSRGRKLDYRKLWLYHELAKLYRMYWGRGRLTASRSNGKGGPSVKYFQFTIKRITGRSPTVDSVHDHIREYVNVEDNAKIVF